MLANCADFQIQNYKIHPYLKAAVELQNMGPGLAIQAMRSLTGNRVNDNKIIVLCRMLFETKIKSEFRRPHIGSAEFLGGTDYSDWPLEPIEIINGIPFLIVRGYSVAGKSELASSYLEYCIASCIWSTLRYELKSDAETRTAVNSLIASSKWKTQLSEEEIEWLFSQIQSKYRER
jgi:hypothetical protein